MNLEKLEHDGNVFFFEFADDGKVWMIGGGLQHQQKQASPRRVGRVRIFFSSLVWLVMIYRLYFTAIYRRYIL